MTTNTEKQTEALKLALEALEESHPEAYRHIITAIHEALTEQKQPKQFDPNESFAREEAAQARVREFMRNH